MDLQALTIGQLAASAAVNVETVRYYQRRGLLSEPKRPAGGIRRYTSSDLARLRYIRRAQTMGFSLDEIVGLLELNGRRACEQTKRLTENKLLDVRKRLGELRKLERQLSQLVASCGEASVGAFCPTLELLEHAGTEPLPRSRGQHVRSSRADAA
ncbi:MerR family transcriptional regulator [Arenimonas sp.]|jgi:MerR family mercuric resistance operon transcriptional regulator|uniref:MerR family transcriptional regulator n=1 Tax=Arenimonas sp. TaxID=1872635 RepID=UPI0035AEA14B